MMGNGVWRWVVCALVAMAAFEEIVLKNPKIRVAGKCAEMSLRGRC